MLTWQTLMDFAEAQGVKPDDVVVEIILQEKDTPDNLKVYRDSENRVEIW